MEQITTKLKKWGNSLGLIVPKEIINKEKLKEGADVVFTFTTKKVTTVSDLMKLSKTLNINKKLRKSTEQIMKETDEAFWSE